MKWTQQAPFYRKRGHTNLIFYRMKREGRRRRGRRMIRREWREEKRNNGLERERCLESFYSLWKTNLWGFENPNKPLWFVYNVDDPPSLQSNKRKKQKDLQAKSKNQLFQSEHPHSYHPYGWYKWVPHNTLLSPSLITWPTLKIYTIHVTCFDYIFLLIYKNKI